MEKALYLDENLSFEERAKDLVSRMTLEEKAGQTVFSSPAIPRLGIKAYNWWNEALHGVARAGTATVFPQAIGLAATFDEDFIEEVANIISEEGRAKYNMQQEKEDYDIYKGLTFWSPNINIFRDPRWGRGHETYGEDPYLTGRLGLRFIKGLQGEGKYMKAAACAKHFAVHSGPEDERHSFNAIVGEKDLNETYLPAFKLCVEEGKVESVMGAYNRTNGEPCCGSKTLLQGILRDKWNFKGHVTSDCWAIKDFHEFHKVTATAVESVAMAINNGCDTNCGHMYLNLLLAHKEGLVSEETITQAVERLMLTRMKLGMFDSVESVSFNKIPYSVVDCKEHRDINTKAAEKSIVLLKNDNILPLDKSKIKSIGVIGPNADNRAALEGNYQGMASRYITVLGGIQDYCGDEITVRYSEGCHLHKDRIQGLSRAGINDRLSEALAIAELSDVVVICLGLDPTLEGEEGDTGNEFASGDKKSLEIPGKQVELLCEVIKTGKPIILVSLSGSAITYGGLDENVNALIQAFYPGAQGGKAIASILFGDVSPEGKLPVTFYKSTEELPSFTDYNMENRTYRYMTNTALYPFGYGLSYTSFSFSDMQVNITEGNNVTCSVTIKNTGSRKGAETAQLYIKANIENAPNYQLKGLKKVTLMPDEEATITFELKAPDFSLFNENGELVLNDCAYDIFIGASQPDKRSEQLTNTKSLQQRIQFNM